MTRDETGQERRAARRFKAKLRILFQRSGTTHFLDAETDNISSDGVYVRTIRKPLPKGTTISLLLTIYGQEHELMINGEIAWVSEETPKGMGIRFTEMTEETRKNLLKGIEGLDS
jgi:uncharacterized protein (TIGR02266 family)